jgi:hypothetical protein
MAPTYEQLALSHSQKIQFLEVDVDKSPMLATNVEAIPLFIFYRNGNKDDEYTVRGASIQRLIDNVTRFASSLEKLVVVEKAPPVILERLADDNVEASGSDFEDYPDPDDELPESEEPVDEPAVEPVNGEPIIEKTIPENLIQSSD